MRLFKLQLHQKTFSEEDVLINSKDAEDLKIGDLIEIYSNDVKFSHLLLKITSISESKDFQTKDQKPVISIEQSIAHTFQLRARSEVVVQKIDPKIAALDSVEITFKDQYLSRSDMWRLKRHLVGSCVHLNKKISYIGLRCQVFETWSQGERVGCGYISEDTKIVFRSASSMVYLFIQMSSEMWDFDINGDLYFEKAINGFLFDLFEKWKRFNCNHDVTIVLFSRTFYDAKSIDEFPPEMRECLQQDHKKRFYEDFYRVAVQNERFDDWTPTLRLLKEMFNSYQKEVIRYHEKDGLNIPKAVTSTSSQGNFLEVLNMSLNVFERHYLDRSFDRTGQLSVVISPGVGVFEVDFELTNITKQRIIDNGIGSDLVCLGEQPLHAVPLFKFNRGQISSLTAADLYNMPHWINLSFYSTSNSHFCSSFVPRIKMPNIMHNKSEKTPNRELNDSNGLNKICISLMNFDEYDDEVFKPTSNTKAENYTCQPSTRRKSTMSSHFQINSDKENQRRASDASSLEINSPSSFKLETFSGQKKSSALSIPLNNSQNLSSHSPLSTSVENKSTKDFKPKLESKDDLIVHGYNTNTGGKGPSARPKALINPFDPAHVTIKLTSNRRRWTHVFPLGPTGIFMQQHHYQAVPQNTACTLLHSATCAGKKLIKTSSSEVSDVIDTSKMGANRSESSYIVSDVSGSNEILLSEVRKNPRNNSKVDRPINRSLSWAWGATGEQEWTPAIITGVDWKSLVMPACLPITTDFFPDNRSLINDYVESEYTLLAEEQLDNCKTDENGIQVFRELICQRLQQGFQIIVVAKENAKNSDILNPHGDENDLTLSIGRIFHRLKLEGSQLKIKIYKPRHPYHPYHIRYCYRFRAPENDGYGVSWVDFTGEKVENYYWNHLDTYVCSKGESDFKMKPSLKFRTLRILVLPKKESITKKLIQSLSQSNDSYGESYTDCNLEEKISLQDGFMRFMEIVNQLKKSSFNRKSIILNSLRNGNRRRSSSAYKDLKAIKGKIFKIGSKDEVDGNIAIGNMLISDAEYSEEIEVKKKLPYNLSAKSLVDNLKNSNLNFYGENEGLPYFTFISADAVAWAIDNVENVLTEEQGVAWFQNFVLANVIHHASGKNLPFEFGFLFYSIVGEDNNWSGPYKTWFEVKMLPELGFASESSYNSTESVENIHKRLKLKLKETFMNINICSKKGRIEWAHALYQDIYDPEYSYEIQIQWMVATANHLAEIVQGWARKASSNGFHLIPIPNEPFALPFSGKSDPLRGPIFISLNLKSLSNEAMDYLHGDNLIHFREFILRRFGFLHFIDLLRESQRQYVHVSGSIFVLLPDITMHEHKTQTGSSKPEDICSPHEEYITRHFSGVKTTERDGLEHVRTGFLWNWNYMITKRWKTSVTGDENYMRGFLKNFKVFCANGENRLSNFWKTYSETLKLKRPMISESTM